MKAKKDGNERLGFALKVSKWISCPPPQLQRVVAPFDSELNRFSHFPSGNCVIHRSLWTCSRLMIIRSGPTPNTGYQE
jgi:hypothetical protein